MRHLAHFLAWFMLCLLAALPAHGEILVIVDARLPVTRLSQEETINIFLGRHRKFPGGEEAVPIDQPRNSPARALFYQKLTEKSLPEINAYWARLHFSGNTHPPLQAADNAEVLLRILNTAGAIGYVEQAQIDPRFRVVLRLSP